MSSAGCIPGSRRYRAYGRSRSSSGSLHTEHGFTDQVHDGSGLIYFQGRYYDPNVGMFLSPDTLVPDPGLVYDYNRYMYTRGNPLKYNDPSGHETSKPEWWPD